jgi:hypothetical protein
MREELTMLSLLRKEVEKDVREALYNELLRDFIKEAEERFAAVVRPKLAEITIERMECFKNLAAMRNEIHISINGVEESGVKADE